MTKVDQFESAFRSAAKTVFSFSPVEFASILVITDLDEYGADLFAGTVRGFLSVLGDDPTPAWTVVRGDEFETVQDLLDLVERHRPDLICTYRHVGRAGRRWEFTLGDPLEVLTQATTTPVLVLPHPNSEARAGHAMENTSVVMVITDHLTGDDRLVNFGIRFTEPNGTLFLAHVEDRLSYDRYMEIISKLPEIDTDAARKPILEQLLKEPTDYIASCRKALAEQHASIGVEAHVTLGHHLAEYRAVIESHEVDLLVFNTKDQDQMAMHGLAYPLAVEIREIPLLMV